MGRSFTARAPDGGLLAEVTRDVGLEVAKPRPRLNDVGAGLAIHVGEVDTVPLGRVGERAQCRRRARRRAVRKLQLDGGGTCESSRTWQRASAQERHEQPHWRLDGGGDEVWYV